MFVDVSKFLFNPFSSSLSNKIADGMFDILQKFWSSRHRFTVNINELKAVPFIQNQQIFRIVASYLFRFSIDLRKFYWTGIS